MRYGSLFAGIEGIGLGLERAGMECAWQVENNKFCQSILMKHFPNVPRYGDIRNVNKEMLEKHGQVNLIAGGFPCQPFSVAGKRRGTEDNRHLWPEMLRIISELKPAWVLGENVPGIIKIFLDQAISDLETEGYTCESFILPAVAFDAPHRRDRLFIIAYDSQTRARMESGGNSGSGGQRGQFPNASEPTMVRQEHGESSSEGIATSNRHGSVGNSEHIGQSTAQVSRSTSQGGNRSTSRKDSASKSERPSIEYGIVENSRCTYRQGSQEQGKSNRETPHPSIQLERPSGTSRFVPNTERIHAQGCENGQRKRELGGGYRWLPEPCVGRVADGVPNRVDRLKSLGNAVVPQVAEFIGQIIMTVNNEIIKAEVV